MKVTQTVVGVRFQMTEEVRRRREVRQGWQRADNLLWLLDNDFLGSFQLEEEEGRL